MTKITSVTYERGRAQYDYEGTIDGRPFCVQISELAGPHWYSSEVSEDDREEILSEIEAYTVAGRDITAEED